MRQARLLDLPSHPRHSILETRDPHGAAHLHITCEVDVTHLRQGSQALSQPFFLSLSYAVTKAIQSIPELRQRLIDDQLYEFAHIHPRYSVSKENGYATSCAGVYCEDFDDHCRETLSRMAAAKRHHVSDFEPAHDIFVIHHWPWLHFTAMSHPCTNAQAFTPVITLGKHVQRQHQWHMPIAIQAHHGLVDGIHLARFYEALSVVRLL